MAVDRAATADQVIAEALRLRGTPYVWAGERPDGFDCSGFTRYVYGKVGVAMDHSTYAQRDAFPAVERSDLRRGDLVFFSGTGHVGIYMGSGRFIHSPRSGDVVKVSRLSHSWYRTSYSGAVRPPLPA